MNLSHKMALATMAVILSVGGVATINAKANSEAVAAPSGNYSNYSVEQLESLIAKLQAQLAEMKKGSKCFVTDRELSLGDGEPGDGFDGDVRRLQTFLKEKGTFKQSATGYFGKITRGALQSYQKSVGVETTGEFDKATRAKAHASFCKTVAKVNVKEQKKEIKEETKKEEKKVVPTGVVRAIKLIVTNGVAQWKVDGYSAQGFKVVWSKNAHPTYPLREGDRYDYQSDPSATDAKLEAFSGSGTYSVRVCEYLGGKCGTYSNEVSIEL
jgi:hypothetical protein